VILPQLQDELERVARLRPVAWRAGGRALGALVAAVAALLVAAPVAHAEYSPAGPPAIVQQASAQ
jgi:hypothetical protein